MVNIFFDNFIDFRRQGKSKSHTKVEFILIVIDIFIISKRFSKLHKTIADYVLFSKLKETDIEA